MAHPDTLNKKTIIAKLPLGALAEFIYELYERSHFNSSGLNEGLPLW